MEAGKSGNSSTEIMCSEDRWCLARSQASASALMPPSEPSFATTMCLNTSDLLLCYPDLGQEPLLGDHRRPHRAQDHCGEEVRVLPLVDDVVRQTIKRPDRAE